jgi:hypothetical protein
LNSINAEEPGDRKRIGVAENLAENPAETRPPAYLK